LTIDHHGIFHIRRRNENSLVGFRALLRSRAQHDEKESGGSVRESAPQS
jgi:hypothetical protein